MSTEITSLVIFGCVVGAVLGLFMLVMTFATVALMQSLLGRDVLGARHSAR